VENAEQQKKNNNKTNFLAGDITIIKNNLFKTWFIWLIINRKRYVHF
jgi:hypothetical protein